MRRIIIIKLIAGAMLSAFFTVSASADKITPTHSCKQPARPAKFKTEAEVNSYKAEIEIYRKCINDFVEEQNQAIERHRAAANQAITDWNFFVNTQPR